MRVTRDLPLSAINLDRMPFDRVLEFVASFRNGVVCKPIHVKLDPATGVFRVLDGRHRFMAAKLLGWETIPAQYGVAELTTRHGRRVTQVHKADMTKGFVAPPPGCNCYVWEGNHTVDCAAFAGERT
jgi:hypothetical protein